MSSENEAGLRRLFRAAHGEAETAPDFDRLLSSAVRRPRSVQRWIPIATAAALIVAIAVPVFKAHRERQVFEFARELAAWQAPTDALLAERNRSAGVFSGLGGPSMLSAANDMVRWRK
ncbi:MAG: hypothetical protein O7A98_03410 [Acidobacteria bacterium]|nr:hypothetical protein [Acidobacteriota bacterium]MCZ6726387.1 hypothetical protein [Acidobacteriota bacterium]